MSGQVAANPHADFTARKEQMWEVLLKDEDHIKGAEIASAMLQDSHAFDAIHVAGLCLARLGHPEAFDWCCASLSLASAEPRWYINCAIAYMDLKDYVKAMVFLENGIKDKPGDCNIMFQRCLCMAHAQQWDIALRFCDEVIEQFPEFQHAKLTRGFCLHMLERHEESIQQYIEMKDVCTGSEYEEVINNWSCVLMETGKQKAALALLDVYCRDPERTGTIYNKSFLYLGLGKWPEAWQMYRMRETAGIVKREKILPALDQPWAQSIEQITGKTLFMFHEQGLGDDLMFIRYAPIIRKYVSKLILGVPPSMARLAARLNMDADYTLLCGSSLEEDKKQIAEAEFCMPMLDAPAIMQQTVDNIPNEQYFLPVPEALILKRSIEGLCRRNKFRVGLAWAGSSRPDNLRAHAIDRRRSASFALMQPLFELRNQVEFVSLQLEDHRVQDDRVIQPLDNSFDVLDTCAVIAQLDLVISIDSSVVHMAAAFGKPTWMMSRLDQCWRWFWDGRTDSPWYPSLKIYQQREAGDWEDVVARIKHDLAALLNSA